MMEKMPGIEHVAKGSKSGNSEQLQKSMNKQILNASALKFYIQKFSDSEILANKKDININCMIIGKYQQNIRRRIQQNTKQFVSNKAFINNYLYIIEIQTKTRKAKTKRRMAKKDSIEISQLADAPQLEDYQSKPVENYGIKLLQGMGFTQSRGIGKRTNNQLTDILVLKPRPKGLGLGAEMPEEAQKEKLEVGDKVLITADQHKGLTGIINNSIDDKIVEIELQPSKSLIKCEITNLKKISKSQQAKLLQKLAKQSSDKPEKKKHKLRWLVPNIRVKVIDPKSTLYLKKVIITEILGNKQFECRDESGSTFTNLAESDIQTVIPKVSGCVVILKGEFKGEKAVVMDRKKSKGIVVVQTLDGLEIIQVSQDDICEFVEF